jgi:hypothetical protein
MKEFCFDEITNFFHDGLVAVTENEHRNTIRRDSGPSRRGRLQLSGKEARFRPRNLG